MSIHNRAAKLRRIFGLCKSSHYFLCFLWIICCFGIVQKVCTHSTKALYWKYKAFVLIMNRMVPNVSYYYCYRSMYRYNSHSEQSLVWLLCSLPPCRKWSPHHQPWVLAMIRHCISRFQGRGCDIYRTPWHRNPMAPTRMPPTPSPPCHTYY